MTKIETVSTPATRTSRNENCRSPTWNAVSRRPLAETRRDAAELGLHPGAHDDAAAGALAHDRPHQRARPLVHGRLRPSSRPASTHR